MNGLSRFFALTLLAFFPVCSVVYGATNANAPPKEAEERIVAREEFYYYDAKNLRVPLPMTRRVALHFVSQKTDEEMAGYVKTWSPTDTEFISGVYPRADMMLGYLPTVELSDMVLTLKKMTTDQSVEVAPVFLVDGMMAVVDGIYIETAGNLSRDTIVSGLKSVFGTDALIHEVTEEGALWHVSFKRLFFLGDKRLPVHVLSVANILSQSSKVTWVKRAYPKFAFLRDPVYAEIRVTPVSGTVGEERTATLAVRVFGKPGDVVIDETMIPEFKQPPNYILRADGKPPHESFIDLHGGVVKIPLRQVGPNEWYFEHRQVFGLYAPEPEWVISGVVIPYTYKGTKKTATIAPVTFFVRRHLDEKYKLEDFPPPYELPDVGSVSGAPTPPTVAPSWYDPIARRFGGLGSAGLFWTTTFIAATLGVFGIVVVAMPWYRTFRGARLERTRQEALEFLLQRETESMLQCAKTESDPLRALQICSEAVSMLLHARFSALPEYNVTFQHIKEVILNEDDRSVLREIERDAELATLFEAMDVRHAPLYAKANSEVHVTHIADVVERITRLGALLRRS